MSEVRPMPSTTQKARKVHRCDHCGHIIARGDVYQSTHYWDPDRRHPGAVIWGAWVVDRRHLACG